MSGPPRPFRSRGPGGRHRRHRGRSRFSFTRFTAVLAVLALAAGVSVWLATGSVRPRSGAADLHHPTAGAGSTTASTKRSTTTTAPPVTAPTTTTTDPGSLPQTGAFPSSDSVQFDAEMSALWNGIMTDSVTAALPAFFPEQAYEQLKTLNDAGSDYEDRLLADYALDITAAHRLLGGVPSSAVLVRVDVPEQNGHWIRPGVCDNRIGYFEVANSRVVYQQAGATRSFGIASLISWRGVWYVVHLGAVLRSSAVGVVQDPEAGPGSSAPSSTC